MSFSANMIEPLKCSECIANPGVITMDDECKCRLGDGYYEITPTGLLESLVCYRNKCLNTELYIYIYIYLACFPLCLECHNIPTNCTICRSHPDNYIFHIPAPVYECDCVVGSYYNPNKTIPNCYREYNIIYIYIYIIYRLSPILHSMLWGREHELHSLCKSHIYISIR